MLYIGEGSIERGQLNQTTVSSNLLITGRTLLRLAKEVLANCKKMMALVTSPHSPYKDGNSPSGTNWDDYAKWCLDSMYCQEIEDKQGTTSGLLVAANEIVPPCKQGQPRKGGGKK